MQEERDQSFGQGPAKKPFGTTSHFWSSSVRRHPRATLTTDTGRERRAVSPTSGKEAVRDQVPSPSEGRDPSARPGSSQRRCLCPRDGAFWGWRSSWQRDGLAAVRRTPAGGIHDCVIDRTRRSTRASPWFTRSPAPLNGCRHATKWNAELPSMPTGIFEWTL